MKVESLTLFAPACRAGFFTAAAAVLSLTMAPAAEASLTLTFQGSNQARVGVPYSATIAVSGGDGPYTIAVAGLPGLGLTYQTGNFSVAISGTPNAPGTVTVSVTAQDPVTQQSGGATYKITVTGAAIQIAPQTLHDGAVGLAYDQPFTASGGTVPYTFAPIGTPPPGLSLGAGGTISGSPTQPGIFSFGVTVSDSAGNSGRGDYTVLVTSLPTPHLIVTLTDGGVAWGDLAPNYDFGYTISYANIGTAPATNAVLHLLIDGALVAPKGCADAGSPLQRPVDIPLLGSLQPGSYVELEGYEVCLPTVESVTGPAPDAVETYQLISQASISSAETSSNTSVVVTPYCNNIVCTTFCPLRYLTGYPCPEIGFSNPVGSVLVGNAGSPFSEAFQASGGMSPYHYSARDLPAGLVIHGDAGVVDGTPTDLGEFPFTVGVEDAASCHAEQTYTLYVCPADGSLIFSPESSNPTVPYRLPDAIRNRDYSAINLKVLCGLSLSRVDATGLPPGLRLSWSGHAVEIQGTPSQDSGPPSSDGTPSNFPFTLTATDAAGKTATAAYSLHVGHCFLSFSLTQLPLATVGDQYEAELTVTGGENLFSVSVTPACDSTCQDFFSGFFSQLGFKGDFQPPGGSKLENLYGLSFFAAGQGLTLSGKPRLDGNPTFNVTAQDNSDPPCYGTQTYTLNILRMPLQCPQIDIAPESLPDAEVGIPYSASLSASGGSPGYRFGSDDLSLDSGLNLDLAGRLIGTPRQAGALDFNVFAQDRNVCFGARDYSLQVAPNPNCQQVYLSPTTWSATSPAGKLPSGTVGVAYNGISLPANQIGGAGGQRPYTFTMSPVAPLQTNTNPAGLNLAIDQSSGSVILTGTPQAADTYFFTLTATDANNCSGSYRYSIDIQPGQLSHTTASAERQPEGKGLVDLARRVFRRAGEAVAVVRTALRDLTLYYDVRDKVLSQTPKGRQLTELYYHHSPEIASLLVSDGTLRDLAFAAVEAWEPQLRSLARGFGADTRFTQAMADTMTALLTRLKQTGSAELQANIEAQQAALDLSSLVGLPVDAAANKTIFSTGARQSPVRVGVSRAGTRTVARP